MASVAVAVVPVAVRLFVVVDPVVVAVAAGTHSCCSRCGCTIRPRSKTVYIGEQIMHLVGSC